jgi:hypothetical protein
MFGTLVICLPSEHTGGEVHLVRGGKTRILETAKQSQHGLSALAWYSDVQHEIKPVTSGYRLVLTYNILQDQRMPRQTASMLDASHARLEKLLRVWAKKLQYIEKLIYPLEHQYTEASLCQNSLKGPDAAKARYIESLCMKHGVFWFLGRVTKEISVDDESYYTDEDERLFLDYLVTPAGKRLGVNIVHVSKDQILADADNLYAERRADSEDVGGFTGNASMPSTFRYRDTVRFRSILSGSNSCALIHYRCLFSIAKMKLSANSCCEAVVMLLHFKLCSSSSAMIVQPNQVKSQQRSVRTPSVQFWMKRSKISLLNVLGTVTQVTE